MTETEKLQRDIATLRESVRIGWQELSGKDLTQAQRIGLKGNLKWCAHEMQTLILRLELLDASNA